MIEVSQRPVRGRRNAGPTASFAETFDGSPVSGVIGQAIARSGSSGVTATPAMPGVHSDAEAVEVLAAVVGDTAWKPLHTPAGTNIWTPTVSSA